MAPSLAPEIDRWLQNLLCITSGIIEIWFIGSRANGTSRPDSDWDFLAFANPSVLEFLAAETDLQRPDIDFLVSTDGDNFQSAWGKVKSGSLTRWNWLKAGPNLATYTGHTWVTSPQDPDEAAPYDMSSLGLPIISTCKAYKIWPDSAATGA